MAVGDRHLRLIGNDHWSLRSDDRISCVGLVVVRHCGDRVVAGVSWNTCEETGGYG